MSLTDKINEGIKDAMRSKEKPLLEALRSIKAALLMEATKGGEGGVSEKAEMQILTKMYKQRKESADIYRKQGREDLAKDEEFEAGVLESFLPKQLSDEEIKNTVEAIIAETGAEGMKDMGKVMGQATAKMAGRADGKKISDIVKEKLNS